MQTLDLIITIAVTFFVVSFPIFLILLLILTEHEKARRIGP